VRWSTRVSGQEPRESYALFAPEGTVLVDPEEPPTETQEGNALVLSTPPIAIVLTSGWHERAAARLHARHRAPVWAPPVGIKLMDRPPDHVYRGGSTLPGGLRAINIDPARTCNYFLLWPSPSGRRVLFTGDALFGPTDPGDSRTAHPRRRPGLYIPMKGRRAPHLFKLRYRRLLQERFDLVCSGHSAPFADNPHAVLGEVLTRGTLSAGFIG
jgi:hypothetical protein